MAGIPGGSTLMAVLAHDAPQGRGRAVVRGFEGEPDCVVDDLDLLREAVDRERSAHIESLRDQAAKRGVRCVPLVGDASFSTAIVRWVLGTGGA
jgi:hypothetical protein